MAALEERIEELASNRTHGGSWMARQALEALADVAAAEVPTSEELVARLAAAARELSASRPAMGAIAHAVGRIVASAHVASYLPPEELRRLVQEEAHALIASRDRAAASIAIHLAPMLRDALVLTHSASATVREAVTHTPPARVYCTASAPIEEGRTLARELAEAGVSAELVEDDDAPRMLEEACSLLLVGADTVYQDGSIANKIGTRRLAEAAERLGVRCIVACEVLKLVPVDPPKDLDELELRDVTPPELIDEIVTEEGPLAPDEVRSLIDRTPFLHSGWALLRSRG